MMEGGRFGTGLGGEAPKFQVLRSGERLRL